MLPSRGFFKKTDCPFFEKGLCERPHCHFRHRKKVVSENSSSADSQDVLLSEGLTDVPLVDSIDTEKNAAGSEDISETNNDAQHSSTNADSKEDHSNEDSLFAKLVNQSNPYERISRHIPCAYTPTPQTRGVQPKNKTLNAKSSVNSSKAIENLEKTPGYSDGYNSVNNNKQNSSTYVPSQSQEVNSIKNNHSNNLSNEPNNKYSVDFLNNTFPSKNSEFKISFFENQESKSLSYEPQSTSKSIISHLDKNVAEGSVSNYVPSKVTIAESKYTPNTNNCSLPNDYVPSKDKSQRTLYVPEATVSIKNQVTYKPSDKSSAGETQYQPGSGNFVADYVPTEKSAIKASGNSWLDSNCKSEWIDFDFISSEIEMMKELLKEDPEEKVKEKGDLVSKTEYDKVDDSEIKPSHKEKSSKSHSSKSRHRSKSSSHSHSSSKSKHSSSSSCKHSSKTSSSSSRHHSSRSSRYHSSSKSKKSGSHNKKSSNEHKKSSSSHKSSEHHSSHKSHKQTKKRHSNDRDIDERQHSEKKKNKSVSSDENLTDDLVENQKNVSCEETSDTDCESESKKRKNTWTDEAKNTKYFKKSDDELFDDLEDDPDLVEKECLEIFNSYTTSAESNSNKKTNDITIPTDDYENTTFGKKRMAHSTSVMSDHSVLRHKSARRPNNVKSAQEVMLERYKTIEKAKETPVPVTTPQPAPILGLNRPSIRIAAVSNIQQMLQAKKAIQEKINQGIKVNERTTIAQTVSHGGSRVAHTPSAKCKTDRPTISVGSKQIPPVKRQIYLDKLLLETNQIYPTKGESAEEAIRLEEELFRAHSGSFPAYHAAFVSTLMKTRRRIAAVKGDASTSSVARPKVSHYDVLSGGKKNFSVIKTKKVDISMLSEQHIYEELLKCKLSPEELKLNGFPVEGKKPGYACCTFNFELKYNMQYSHIKKMKGNYRYCVRCSKQYKVDPVTLQQYKEGPETCSYHPGKKKSGGRNSERIYTCCNSSSTEGCATHIRHVTDCNDYENLPNCVKTLAKEDKTNPGVYALDCEMIYTRLGYELARVTVVNLKKEVVYDTLVKPKYPVECYNTAYSGIEEKSLEDVETTLKDVQAVLLSMFSDKTILIGHSLDSDLRALHLIHDTVVDTSIVYKNEKYHPYKYSLKDLCAKKISKIIQDNVGGHDSAEDAIAALEIMLHYVKEEVGKYDSLESYEADRMR